MLEPYDGKLSRTVLRGAGDGNVTRLPDPDPGEQGRTLLPADTEIGMT